MYISMHSRQAAEQQMHTKNTLHKLVFEWIHSFNYYKKLCTYIAFLSSNYVEFVVKSEHGNDCFYH